MRCPECDSRSIGRVGAEQYYCWDCCVEFNLARGTVRVYHLDAEGELTMAGEETAGRGRAVGGRESRRRSPVA